MKVEPHSQSGSDSIVDSFTLRQAGQVNLNKFKTTDYGRFEQMGQHYLVEAVETDEKGNTVKGVKRHYSLCHLMKPDVMKAHMDILERAESGGSSLQASGLPSTPKFENTGEVVLTVRNYKTEQGLSSKLHK